jgi:hypothetical protein
MLLFWWFLGADRHMGFRRKQMDCWTGTETAVAVVLLLQVVLFFWGGKLSLQHAALTCWFLIMCWSAGLQLGWLRVALVVSSGRTRKPVAAGCPNCAGQQLSEVFLCNICHALASSFAGLHWQCQAALRASLLQAAHIMLVSKSHVDLGACGYH